MTGPPKRPDIVRLWVEKSEHDLLNIENNPTASHVPWDTVCFHAQQGAENAQANVNGIVQRHSDDLVDTYDQTDRPKTGGIAGEKDGDGRLNTEDVIKQQDGTQKAIEAIAEHQNDQNREGGKAYVELADEIKPVL